VDWLRELAPLMTTVNLSCPLLPFMSELRKGIVGGCWKDRQGAVLGSQAGGNQQPFSLLEMGELTEDRLPPQTLPTATTSGRPGKQRVSDCQRLFVCLEEPLSVEALL
jgi:hypothetical protein